MNVFLSFLLVLVQTWVLVWCFAFGPKWLVKEREAAKRTVSIQVTWFAAVFYLIYSRDKAFSLKQVKDAVHTDLNDPKAKTKTIIFIRHGESKWNECFNRGFGPGFILRLFDGLLSELQRMTFGDSLFIDSPLGRRGEKEVSQAFRKQKTKQNDSFQPATHSSSYLTKLLCLSVCLC
jgi:hypothetical protein